MTTQELLTKTFDFSRGVSNLKHLVPHATYLPQLLDAAAQVGIHYRAAQRTNSPEEFTRKIRMVADAAERSLFYL